MNNMSAYVGYYVYRIVDFVHRRFFRLAWLCIGVSAIWLLTKLAYLAAIDTERFLEYTEWFHDWAVKRGTLS